MNKYFLSLISILLLFQSFVVFDEIFYHEEKILRKGYEIIDKEPDKTEEIKDSSHQTKLDLDSFFKVADVEKGMKVSRQCSACHDFSNNLKIKVGPPLWGIVGRKSAVIADYKYSDALKDYAKNWTRSELFMFLENPKNYIAGTKMIYKGLTKPSDRVNLISYLESLR
tara:strand:- start:249 stop:752 length:504 start_codon:yes stop_codon:yes gene_type:complete